MNSYSSPEVPQPLINIKRATAFLAIAGSVLTSAACSAEGEITHRSSVEGVVIENEAQLIANPLEPRAKLGNIIATVQLGEDEELSIPTPDGITAMRQDGTWYGMTVAEVESTGIIDLPNILSSDSTVWVNSDDANVTRDLDAGSDSRSGSGSGGNE